MPARLQSGPGFKVSRTVLGFLTNLQSQNIPARSLLGQNILVGSLGVKIFLQGPGQVVLQSNFPRSFTPDAILVEYMKRHKYSPTHLTSSDKTDVPSHFPRKSSTLWQTVSVFRLHAHCPDRRELRPRIKLYPSLPFQPGPGIEHFNWSK